MPTFTKRFLISDIKDVKVNQDILISQDGGNSGIEYLVLKINPDTIEVKPGLKILEDGSIKTIPQKETTLNIDSDFFASCYISIAV